MSGPLNRINGMDVWKQWVIMAGALGTAFIAGTTLSGFLHAIDGPRHRTDEVSQAAFDKAMEKVDGRLDALSASGQAHERAAGHSVLEERQSRHEVEAARQFLELTKQIDSAMKRIDDRQADILREVRKGGRP